MQKIYCRESDVQQWLKQSCCVFNSFVLNATKTVLDCLRSAKVDATVVFIHDHVEVLVGAPVYATIRITGLRIYITRLGSVSESCLTARSIYANGCSKEVIVTYITKLLQESGIAADDSVLRYICNVFAQSSLADAIAFTGI